MIILLNFNSNTKLDNGVTCKANSKQNEIRRNVPKQKKIRESKSRQNHSLITCWTDIRVKYEKFSTCVL